MWVCKFLVKIVTQITESLYNYRLITFIVSIGSVADSLLLMDILDDDV